MAEEERLTLPRHDELEGFPLPAEAGHPVGHDDLWQRLTAAYREGRMPHALLLVGPPGIGKATFAYRLARYLLTFPDRTTAPETGPDFDLPNTLFRQVASGAHPGVLHISRPFNSKAKTFRSRITVDEIRGIGRYLAHTSHDGSFRTVIVDPAEDMNVNAANALLKVLEEPPRGTVFVLLSHQPGRLLPTIRSRCQLHRMTALAPADLSTVVARLDLDVPPEMTPSSLAELAEGSVREAILLLAFGGLDIVRTTDAIADDERFDDRTVDGAASAIGGRGADEAFEQFNRHVLDRLARAAVERATAGRAGEADAIAFGYAAIRDAARDVRIYNLDRRHHVQSTLRQLHRLMHGHR